MSPTCCELNAAAIAEPVEAGITVDLKDAAEPGQMRSRTFGLSIGTVEIDRSRRIAAVPGAVITGVDPQPPGLGAATARIEHRDRGVIGEQLLRRKDLLGEPRMKRLEPPARAANPVGKC